MSFALLATSALAGRVQNTTLKLPVAPQHDGYTIELAFPGTVPLWATGAATAPGDTNRMFFLGKGGLLYVVTNLSQPNISVFLDISARTVDPVESGLLGLAFHPGWRTNRQFYVFYSTGVTNGATGVLYQRVARFLIDPADPNRALPDSEEPLISQLDQDPGHNAGDLEFGPDGYLYVSVGDGGGAFDTFKNSQQYQKDFFSAILRLDVDRRPENLEPNPHPAVFPGTYRVPADNPLVGLTTYFEVPLDPTKTRTEFFATGFRNPFRMTFDSATGELWADDVGQNRREEINHVVAGGNYGWIVFEGTIPWPYYQLDEPYQFPVYEYEHEQGRVAVTGSTWYHGNRYPDLKGAYVFADFGGPIGAMTLDPAGKASVRWFANRPGISDVAVNPTTGEILFTTVLDGQVYKLVLRHDDGPPIPGLLSQTGIFADLNTLQPNPGVEPYEINVPFWSDNALKQRWFSLPDPQQLLGFSPTGAWDSPAGAVWVKHFELELVRGDPTSRRRLETRVLVRSEEGLWGATYRWNDAQTDAELVPEAGRDETLMVQDGGVLRAQKWHYPGRDECLSCHNAAAGWTLGFNTAQLNRDVLQDGQPTNQLARLMAAGYFRNPPSGIHSLPVLADAADERWSLDYRVHSYLVANCAQCHRPGGPTRATWDGRLDTPLNEAGLLGVLALNNIQDIFAMDPTYLVSAGHPDTSAVFRRVADLAPYHMPPLATSELNQAAIDLLGRWITNDLPQRVFTYAAWTNTIAAQHPGFDAAPYADPDNDGLVNEAEFLLGEPPLDNTGAWRPLLLVGPEGLRLRFVRKANVRFEVQWATSANGAWQPVDAPENGWFVGAVDEVAEVPLPVGPEASFYRVTLAGP